eukprot:scaffold509253_cov47-Prasinocladus_malaysianus.AAC.1
MAYVLSQLLPPTFEELPTEFACGVCCKDGTHRVINTGPLAEAVVASASIPVLFAPVKIPGQEGGPFQWVPDNSQHLIIQEIDNDGGKMDRIGLKQWRDFRRAQVKVSALPPSLMVHSDDVKVIVLNGELALICDTKVPPALVHLIGRSSPFSGNDMLQTDEKKVTMVKSPKSGVNFFSLGKFREAKDAAQQTVFACCAVFRREPQRPWTCTSNTAGKPWRRQRNWNKHIIKEIAAGVGAAAVAADHLPAHS